MDKGSAFDGFTALYDGSGNADETLGLSVQTKVVLDYELAQLCQEHGDRPHRGTPLGRMPELWPFDMLKRPLVEHAQEFTRQVKTQGYQPLTDVYSFRVWGPYMEKVAGLAEYEPEKGNHVIPKHLQRKAQKVWGYRGDEFNWNKGVAFIIAGSFERAAKHGHVAEETGVIVL